MRIFEYLVDTRNLSLDEQFQCPTIMAPFYKARNMRSLSRVCRGWLFPAQPFLYRFVNIESVRKFALLMKTLQANESLGGYTQSLQLRSVGIGPDYGTTVEELQKLFAVLPNLQQIYFDRVDIHCPGQRLFENCCPQLKWMSITGKEKYDGVLPSVLSILPESLIHLHLYWTSIADPCMPQLPHLRYLRLEMIPELQNKPSALRSLAKCPMLDTLYLRLQYHKGVKELLQDLGPAIRKLYIDAGGNGEVPRWLLSSLSKITDLIVFYSAWPGMHLQLPSSIETITWISAWIGICDDVKTFDELTEALKHPSFLPNLRYMPKVDFDIHLPDPDKREWAEQKLRNIHKSRGIPFDSRTGRLA